jgi:hypothetical protein
VSWRQVEKGFARTPSRWTSLRPEAAETTCHLSRLRHRLARSHRHPLEAASHLRMLWPNAPSSRDGRCSTYSQADVHPRPPFARAAACCRRIGLEPAT